VIPLSQSYQWRFLQRRCTPHSTEDFEKITFVIFLFFFFFLRRWTARQIYVIRAARIKKPSAKLFDSHVEAWITEGTLLGVHS